LPVLNPVVIPGLCAGICCAVLRGSLYVCIDLRNQCVIVKLRLLLLLSLLFLVFCSFLNASHHLPAFPLAEKLLMLPLTESYHMLVTSPQVIIIIIIIIIIIERKDLGGVMSKDCKDTLMSLQMMSSCQSSLPTEC